MFRLILTSIALFLPLYTKASLPSHIDWVAACNLCHGVYQEPELLVKNSNSQLILEADSADISLQNYSFFKNVSAYYQDNALFAAYAKVASSNAKRVTGLKLAHGLSFFRPGMRVNAVSGTFNFLDELHEAYDVEYYLYQLHLRGQSRKMQLTKNSAIIYNGTITSCAPHDTSWLLKTQRTNINLQAKEASAINAVLYLKGLPILYLPYINFPLGKQRKSGFLAPTFGSSSIHGEQVSLPLYLNVASNFDWQIDTNYMSKRGTKYNNTLRYLNHYSYSKLKFDFLPMDKIMGKSRYYMNLESVLEPVDESEVRVIFIRSKDKSYSYDFFNYGQNNIDSRSYISATYLHKLGLFKLHSDDYTYSKAQDREKVANQFKLNSTLSFQSRKIKINSYNNLLLDTNFARFTDERHDSNINRISLKTKIDNTFAIDFLSVENTLVLSHASYFHETSSEVAKNQQQAVKHANINNYALRSKVYTSYYAPAALANYLPKHNFTPWCSYVYSSGQNYAYMAQIEDLAMSYSYKNLNRIEKFYSIDGQAPLHAINLGLDFSFFAKTAKLHFALGQRYNFAFADTWSPRALLVEITKANSILSLEWNTKRSTEQLRLNSQFKLGANAVLNFGYQYDASLMPDNIKQLYLSLGWQIFSGVTAFVHSDYDLANKRDLRSAAGFEYQACCLGVRALIDNTWRANPHNLFEDELSFKLQIIFKGLGGLGSAPNSYLARLVPGFKAADFW